MEKNGQLHASCRFTPERESFYPLNGGLDGFQSQSGGFGKKKPILSSGIQTPDCVFRRLVGILTTLPRLPMVYRL
jgi:hypothetical protein